MKKMKKAVAFEASQPLVAYEDARTRFKHQSLMQDFEELEKETESMKSKLQIMQQKKLTLLAEVRFLRRRFKYLTDKQPIIMQQPKRGNSQPQNHENRRSGVLKAKKNSKKESVFRYPPPTSFDLNRKDVNFNAQEVASSSQKTALVFDLNQKARAFGAKDFAFRIPRPALDLNQQDRIHSGKDAAKRKNVPFFDLNQISGEEEESQDHCEPLKGLLRNNANSDEHQNDMKLIACRNIENGPSRSGKRKITWQDQVALRV